MAPTTDVERAVAYEFRRKLRQLGRLGGAMSREDRVEVITRLAGAIERDTKKGLAPSETQALSLAAHAFKLAIEEWRL